MCEPFSIKCAHRLLHCSAMKQVDVSLRVSNMSPILELPSMILELPTTVKGVASSEIPPTVKQVAGGEQHVVGWGGAVKKTWLLPRHHPKQRRLLQCHHPKQRRRRHLMIVTIAFIIVQHTG